MGISSYHGATATCDSCGYMVVDATSECATQKSAIDTARGFGASVSRGVVTCETCKTKEVERHG